MIHPSCPVQTVARKPINHAMNIYSHLQKLMTQQTYYKLYLDSTTSVHPVKNNFYLKKELLQNSTRESQNLKKKLTNSALKDSQIPQPQPNELPTSCGEIVYSSQAAESSESSNFTETVYSSQTAESSESSNFTEKQCIQPPDKGQTTKTVTDNANAPNHPKTCVHYIKGTCRHGMSGNSSGKCKFHHPKMCGKLLKHGTHSPYGCNKGKQCDLFHPRMCSSSLIKGECYNHGCNYKHVKGTKRLQPSWPNANTPEDAWPSLLDPAHKQSHQPYSQAHSQPYLQYKMPQKQQPLHQQHPQKQTYNKPQFQQDIQNKPQQQHTKSYLTPQNPHGPHNTYANCHPNAWDGNQNASTSRTTNTNMPKDQQQSQSEQTCNPSYNQFFQQTIHYLQTELIKLVDSKLSSIFPPLQNPNFNNNINNQNTHQT